MSALAFDSFEYKLTSFISLLLLFPSYFLLLWRFVLALRTFLLFFREAYFVEGYAQVAGILFKKFVNVHLLEVWRQNFEHSFEIEIKFLVGSLPFAKVKEGLLFLHSDEIAGLLEDMDDEFIRVHE